MKESGLEEELCACAGACGSDRCGIVPVDGVDGFAEAYERRIREIPDSPLFCRHVEDLLTARQRFPWAKSLVILVFHASPGSCRADMPGDSFFGRERTGDSGTICSAWRSGSLTGESGQRAEMGVSMSVSGPCAFRRPPPDWESSAGTAFSVRKRAPGMC